MDGDQSPGSDQEVLTGFLDTTPKNALRRCGQILSREHGSSESDLGNHHEARIYVH